MAILNKAIRFIGLIMWSAGNFIQSITSNFAP
jgi:hypothetical protein